LGTDQTAIGHRKACRCTYDDDRSSVGPSALPQFGSSRRRAVHPTGWADKLRALAVTSGTRSQALPDVPTVGEFVPGYEANVSNGIVAAKNTPAEIIDKLHKEIDAALVDPKVMGASPT
jgi:hypothetical protein